MAAGVFAMTWWLWLIAAVLLAGMAAFLAFLSLSAGSAYGANYHSLTRRQRAMGRLLYLGSLTAALACAATAMIAALMTVRALLA